MDLILELKSGLTFLNNRALTHKHTNRQTQENNQTHSQMVTYRERAEQSQISTHGHMRHTGTHTQNRNSGKHQTIEPRVLWKQVRQNPFF